MFCVFNSGFGGYKLETTVIKTKKNHQNSILRDSSRMVFFWCFLGFYNSFGGLSWFFGGFFFYNDFGGQELETTVKNKKNHQNSISRDNLKIVLFCFSSFLQWFWRFLVVGGFS